MSACTPRIGIWAAILSVLFAACFSIVALAANFTTLIPAIWVNPLSFAPSLLLAWSYLVLMACVLDAALPGQRVWALLGLCFAVLYSTLARKPDVPANLKAAADPIHCHVAGSSDV